ncbi:hypothetical protein [Nitrobacter sp.]|uniref:hypothetical protein n=1 Tax=Nitrobacter sp. TaxID=29420 RepID=UPI0025E0E8DE|nr:hypothetical protein [Nitrobacter sp.]
MSGAAMLAGGKAFDGLAAVDDLLKPETAAADRIGSEPTGARPSWAERDALAYSPAVGSSRTGLDGFFQGTTTVRVGEGGLIQPNPDRGGYRSALNIVFARP